jgi:hypothetical protein
MQEKVIHNYESSEKEKHGSNDIGHGRDQNINIKTRKLYYSLI